MPGMNAEVEVSIAARENVLSLPVMALRTDRDIPTTASLLGLVESDLRRETLAGSSRQITNPNDGTDTETVFAGRALGGITDRDGHGQNSYNYGQAALLGKRSVVRKKSLYVEH